MTNKKDSRTSTTLIMYIFVPILFCFLIFISYQWIISPRKLPKEFATETNTAIRGQIFSKDGFLISYSQKLYKVQIDTRSIDKNKIDLFVNLYSIYTNSDKQYIKKLILSHKGNVTLSLKIDAKTAMHLKELARTFNEKKVFTSFKIADKTYPPIGMSIIESGEKRNFAISDSLTPIIGYMKKNEIDKLTKVNGQKGLERYYDMYLKPEKDSLIKGPRDIANNIILEKFALKSKRIDGYDVILNINLKFQKGIERIISQSQKELNAEEIVAAVMESKTGKILSLASSKRYNPNKIQKSDIPALNSTASEYSYEPGSVIKPIIFSILYENNKINLNETINTHNGAYKLGKRTITDTHPFKSMNVKDVIVYSSNIGMIVLSSRLDSLNLYNGLMNFGFSKKTGIDLPFEQTGIIPSPKLLQNETYKATTSYGYGLRATFLQLLSAYNILNNDGKFINPRIVTNLKRGSQLYVIDPPESKEVIKQETAEIIKEILNTTIMRIVKNKSLNEIYIGGKTGTARIASSKGGYLRAYNSSFFGFANKNNNKYTIGVFVKNPKEKSYYAAQTALPIFEKIVLLMKDENLFDGNLNER